MTFGNFVTSYTTDFCVSTMPRSILNDLLFQIISQLCIYKYGFAMKIYWSFLSNYIYIYIYSSGNVHRYCQPFLGLFSS